MKNLIHFAFTALLLVFASNVTAQQTVTIANNEGVDITYELQDGNATAKSFDTLASRIIVPDEVVYQGTSYTVYVDAQMFNDGNNVRTIGMPATYDSILARSFVNCPNLDTVIFGCQHPAKTRLYDNAGNPIESPAQWLLGRFLQADLFNKLTVIVPDGRLAEWRNSVWGYFRKLQSPSSVWLGVGTVDPELCPVDGYVDGNVFVENFPNPGDSLFAVLPRICNAGFYEIGDTAKLYTVPTIRFFTWSDGNGYPEHDYVVRGTDSVTAHSAAVAYLNSNNVLMPFSSFGVMACTGETSSQRVPANSNTGTLFAQGLWIGGIDADSMAHTVAAMFLTPMNYQRVTPESITENFRPGPLRVNDATTDTATMLQFNHVWSVSREQIDYHIAHIADPGYRIPDDIATWPGNGDTARGYAQQLAPFYDADGDGLYKARNGDYPLIRGDQALFAIFNDHAATDPLGVEVHAMVYAFDEPADTAMNNTVFVHYDVINRSAQNYTDTYFGSFCDFDLGYAWDDFIGCDVQHGMFYAYNGFEQDGYGTNSYSGIPPAQSCSFLSSPSSERHSYADTSLVLNKFLYYDNSPNSICGNPRRTHDYYNYMSGYWMNDEPIRFGGNGVLNDVINVLCDYMFPGDSDPLNLGTGGTNPADSGYTDYWTEITAGDYPGDRRGLGSSGPFTFEAGQTRSLDLAFTTSFADSGNAFSSVELLRSHTDRVRSQFESDTTSSGKPFAYSPYSAPYNAIADVKHEPQTMHIYPNPTLGMVTVDLGSEAAGSTVAVFDITGRLVAESRSCDGRVRFNTEQWHSGIYIIRANGRVARMVKK